MAQNDKKGLGFILIVSVVTLTISFYQTAIGYLPLFGGIFTWVVSLIVTLFMLKTNLQIRSALLENRSVIGLVLFYFLIASISVAGNFNAFYSRSMKAQLYDRELREYESALPALSRDAVIELQKTSNYRELEEAVRAEETIMYTQIMNRGDCGFGERAQEHAKNIEKLLNRKLTVLNGSCKQIADGMRSQVESILATVKQSKNQDVDPLVAEIEEATESTMNLIRAALDPLKTKELGRNSLETALSNYNRICSSTSRIVPTFECVEKRPKNLEVGQLGHTFTSAFGGAGNRSDTFISLMASLFIDFLVPVFIFLTTGKSSDSNQNSNTGTSESRRIIPQKKSWWDKLTGGGDEPGAREL